MKDQLIDYLASLPKEKLHRTVKGMQMKQKGMLVAGELCDGKACPEPGTEQPSPNGSYSCIDKVCTWIPDV